MVSIVFPENTEEVIDAIKNAHPYEEPLITYHEVRIE